MFLEKIYRGNFDARAFPAAVPAIDEARLGRILGLYRETLGEHVRQPLETEGGISPDLLRRMGEAGFFGLTISREYGGLGLNLWEYLKVVEEMVKLDISIAIAFLAHLSIGVKGIDLFGNEEQKRKYLPLAASGKMIFAYALTEPRIGSDAQHIETLAVPDRDGSHYLLNGQKAYITNANYAGGLTVFAQLDPKRPGFMGAFVVETGWEGVRVGPEIPKMGLKASSTAAISFRNVRVPVQNLLGAPGDGFRIAMSVLNYGRLGLGAASAALLDQSASDMLKRASSRIQFQVPIKSFQLVQEKIVRAKVNARVSSAMNRFAAGLLERRPLGNAAIETSHCKLFGTTRAWDAVYDALQVAGGSGYLKTHPYEKRMRDFRVATVFEGTTEIHSIYPALVGMRQLGRELQESGGSMYSRAVRLARMCLSRTKWPLRIEDATMRRALAQARANGALIRRLLCAGTLIYGKKIAEREFFLRRITTLSVYMFGILALLSDAMRREGGASGEDLCVLRYFVEEAGEVRRQNNRLFDSKKERLHGAVFRDLDR